MWKVFGPALLVSLLACASGAPREERSLAQASASTSAATASPSTSLTVTDSAASPATSSPTAATGSTSAGPTVPSFPAPAWPPSDQDFALVAVPLKNEGGSPCMISRELIDSVPRANVEVAYAQDGRLTRREQWEFYWATRTATLRSSTRYTWAEGRIVSRQEEQSVTTLGYDAEGLPLRIETKPLPGFSWAPLTLTYEWKGRRLRTKPKLGFPSRADGVMLPLWIPFHGTVKVVRTSSLSKREETVTFNAQGFRSSQGWASSASVPLVPPPPQTWRWVGTQMVESTSGPQMHADIAWPEVRSTFTYDAEGRPTSYLHFQSNHEGGRVQTSEQRYEYRCPGEFVADPLWGP